MMFHEHFYWFWWASPLIILSTPAWAGYHAGPEQLLNSPSESLFGHPMGSRVTGGLEMLKRTCEIQVRSCPSFWAGSKRWFLGFFKMISESARSCWKKTAVRTRQLLFFDGGVLYMVVFYVIYRWNLWWKMKMKHHEWCSMNIYSKSRIHTSWST